MRKFLFVFLLIMFVQAVLYAQVNPYQLSQIKFHKDLLKKVPTINQLVLSPINFSQVEGGHKAPGKKNGFIVPVQILFGTMGGFAIGLGTGLGAAPILPDVSTGGSDDFPASVIAGYAGYLYGVSYIVDKVGQHAGFKSSLEPTLFGSALGALLGFYLYDTEKKGGLILFGPPILATFCFHIAQGA